MNIVRKIDDNFPPQPKSRSEIQFSNVQTTTSNGDNFILSDSGSDDENRVIIFGTQQNLSILKKCKMWRVDATFDVSPRCSISCTPFMGSLRYCTHYSQIRRLKPTKKIFQTVKSLCDDFQPDIILIDFETAVINALRTIFSAADLHARVFFPLHAMYLCVTLHSAI